MLSIKKLSNNDTYNIYLFHLVESKLISLRMLLHWRNFRLTEIYSAEIGCIYKLVDFGKIDSVYVSL